MAADLAISKHTHDVTGFWNFFPFNLVFTMNFSMILDLVQLIPQIFFYWTHQAWNFAPSLTIATFILPVIWCVLTPTLLTTIFGIMIYQLVLYIQNAAQYV